MIFLLVNLLFLSILGSFMSGYAIFKSVNCFKMVVRVGSRLFYLAESDTLSFCLLLLTKHFLRLQTTVFLSLRGWQSTDYRLDILFWIYNINTKLITILEITYVLKQIICSIWWFQTAALYLGTQLRSSLCSLKVSNI